MESQLTLDQDSCFVKCAMPNQYNIEKIKLPIYTGDNPDEVELSTFERRTGKSKTQWVQKKIKDCQSENPEDCLMWCFEEFDIETETIFYVTDTIATTAFQYISFENKILTLQGGHLDWVPSVCKDDVDKRLIVQVGFKLSAKGYIQRRQCDGTLSEPFILALNKFQEDNFLPIGGFNLPTMDLLKVNF